MIKILLDSGHYLGYNKSPVNPLYAEGTVMFKLTNYLKQELEAYGFEVGLTRTDNTKDLALWTRGQMAKDYDLLLTMHSNAATSSATDYPVSLSMLDDDKITFDDVSRTLGAKLADVISETMKTVQEGRVHTKQSANDRDGNGEYDDEYYGVLDGAKQAGVAGIIVEHSFHTNAKATAWLLVDNNLRALAKAEAKAIAEYYSVNQLSYENAVALLNTKYQANTVFFLQCYKYKELVTKLAQALSDGKKFEEIGLAENTLIYLQGYVFYDDFVKKFNEVSV